MNNVALVALLALLVVPAVSCGGDNKVTPDAPVVTPDASGPDCFSGTPTKHEELLNACVDQSVTRIIKYPDLAAMRAALPKLNPDGSLPILP